MHLIKGEIVPFAELLSAKLATARQSMMPVVELLDSRFVM